MVKASTMTQNRKNDHIELAIKSQLAANNKLSSFNYEPLFCGHPEFNSTLPISFLGHQLDFPLWISSMTGGTANANKINVNLANIARDFKIGMGLGSCRPLLDSDYYFNDFNLRPILGPDLPLFVNFGIAQLEKLIASNQLDKLHFIIDKLKATGLIIHVNPLQEWFQPEGDKFLLPPIVTIEKIIQDKKYPIIVKEVGQGMGPKSLQALLELKVDCIELAGFGGTNFSILELLRKTNVNKNYSSNELARVGHTPLEMIEFLNDLALKNKSYKNTDVIISGGIQNILEGQYYRSVLQMNSVVGQAKRYLEFSEDMKQLESFFKDEIGTLLMAKNYLQSRMEEK